MGTMWLDHTIYKFLHGCELRVEIIGNVVFLYSIHSYHLGKNKSKVISFAVEQDKKNKLPHI